MKALHSVETFDGPCLQIQADLSAMLDGELDAASVRRVMVHSDCCPSCCGFLEGIRTQARAHRDLYNCLTRDESDVIEIATGPDGRSTTKVKVAELRRQLTENRRQLARIFYELGRGFVLMGVSPSFSRIVLREPVPIPDMFQRGRNLLDEVERMTGDSHRDTETAGAVWVRAKELFVSGGLRSPEDNLQKGQDLLREALMLAPDFHEARIYLGHAYHVGAQRDLACREFRIVLRGAADLSMRAFALLNLGNVKLEEGDFDQAIEAFVELVEMGAIDERPQFGLVYFNLALAYGLRNQFDECESWLHRLYSEMPHKRRMISDEIRSRADFVEAMSRRPEVLRRLSERFPCWFRRPEDTSRAECEVSR